MMNDFSFPIINMSEPERSLERSPAKGGSKKAPTAGDWKGLRLGYDVQRIRRDFPILRRKVYGRPLVYLDNAATTQKPQQVIEAIARYYAEQNANVHRGVHYLSEKATHEYECVRCKVRQFIHAAEDRQIIFVRGATEGINLIAHSFGGMVVGEGDEVLISAMEHHSNIVPWQILCQQKGASLKVIPVDDDGELQLDEYEKLLTPRTKLVSVTHVSNVLGTINPIRKMIEMAHRHGIPVVVDGAQAVPHLPVDVQALDCEFYVFSAHKIYGPTGIGILYGKEPLLEAMPPYQSGGDMISAVTFEKTLYNRLPFKFEAGTPNIAGAIGLGAALDYVTAIGIEAISHHERQLLTHATELLSEIQGLRIIGTAPEKAGVLSFVLEGVHPHDIGTILDQEGVAIRAGHHCAQPLMQRFGLAATARASFALYNTHEEVEILAGAIKKVREVFA